MKRWRCSVCGYIHEGINPPKECPRCESSGKEFVDLDKISKLKYDGKKFDVLLINGSTHKAHNSGILTSIAEEELKKKRISYKKFNLNELNIQHCWCCYSMEDADCTYPCRNQLDDAHYLHEMVINSKAIIIVSPINWNSMSARLKDFLDRLTCIQNTSLIKKPNLTAGKVLGILINGHEDGALKTAMDIFPVFQQMGYILAPFGFAYVTHQAGEDAKTDNPFFRRNSKIKKDVQGVVNNVLEMIKLNPEEKLKGKLKFICE